MADLFFQYPRSESNRDQRNRNPLFYPLNYRGILFPKGTANLHIFHEKQNLFHFCCKKCIFVN